MKGSRMALEGLAHLLLGGVKLHVPVDGTPGSGRDAPDKAPLTIRGQIVVDDLIVRTDGRVTIEHLDWGGITAQGPVGDRSRGYEGEIATRCPLPEDDGLRH